MKKLLSPILILITVTVLLSAAESKSLGLVLDTTSAAIYEFGFTNDIVTGDMSEAVEQVDSGELVLNKTARQYENSVSFFWRVLSLDKFRLKMSHTGNFGNTLTMSMGDTIIKADSETVVKDNLGGILGVDWGVQTLRFVVSADVTPGSYTETIVLTIESAE